LRTHRERATLAAINSREITRGVTMKTLRFFAKPAQPKTEVNFEVPAGACDCHTPIHADPEKFPFFAGRVYTPEPASPEEMAALHKALHIDRVVIVTPSVYGDNAATGYGIRTLRGDARGDAVIDDKTPQSELDALGHAGIRDIRLNLVTGGTSDPSVGRQYFQAAIAFSGVPTGRIRILSRRPDESRPR
jgi:hypothetical protein